MSAHPNYKPNEDRPCLVYTSRMTDDWQHLTGDTIVMSTARQGYSEGPVMFKRKGIYYYIYTCLLYTSLSANTLFCPG